MGLIVFYDYVVVVVVFKGFSSPQVGTQAVEGGKDETALWETKLKVCI